MPLIQISLVEGRDEEAIKRCIKEVARTVHQTLGAPLATIRIVVQPCRIFFSPLTDTGNSVWQSETPNDCDVTQMLTY